MDISVLTLSPCIVDTFLTKQKIYLASQKFCCILNLSLRGVNRIGKTTFFAFFILYLSTISSMALDVLGMCDVCLGFYGWECLDDFHAFHGYSDDA